MEQALKLGLIGCGGIGRAHAAAAAAVPEVRLVAVADTDQSRAAALAAEFKADTAHTSHRELLRTPGLDALLVTVPTHVHAPVVTEALAAGLHVLCEKPPAATLAEAETMARAAETADRVLMFGYHRRHFTVHHEARRLIRAGELGPIHYARVAWLSSRFKPEQGRHCFQWSTRGAAMASLGSHMLDLAWWLMDCPRWTRITARAHRELCAAIAPEDPGDDLMVGLVELENGCTILVEASRCLQRKSRRHVELYGRTGSYHENGVILRAAADGNLAETRLGTPPAADDNNQIPQLRHFVRAVRGELEPDMGIADALAMQSMLDALYHSAETGEPVCNHPAGRA